MKKIKLKYIFAPLAVIVILSCSIVPCFADYTNPTANLATYPYSFGFDRILIKEALSSYRNYNGIYSLDNYGNINDASGNWYDPLSSGGSSQGCKTLSARTYMQKNADGSLVQFTKLIDAPFVSSGIKYFPECSLYLDSVIVGKDMTYILADYEFNTLEDAIDFQNNITDCTNRVYFNVLFNGQYSVESIDINSAIGNINVAFGYPIHADLTTNFDESLYFVSLVLDTSQSTFDRYFVDTDKIYISKMQVDVEGAYNVNSLQIRNYTYSREVTKSDNTCTYYPLSSLKDVYNEHILVDGFEVFNIGSLFDQIIGSFASAEIASGITIGGILALIITTAIILFICKVWLGG